MVDWSRVGGLIGELIGASAFIWAYYCIAKGGGHPKIIKFFDDRKKQKELKRGEIKNGNSIGMSKVSEKIKSDFDA